MLHCYTIANVVKDIVRKWDHGREAFASITCQRKSQSYSVAVATEDDNDIQRMEWRQ